MAGDYWEVDRAVYTMVHTVNLGFTHSYGVRVCVCAWIGY